MGLIRKTVSVATLGVVPFRSKKEELRRAERARRCAEKALERERAARERAERRKVGKSRSKRSRSTAAIEGLVAAAEPLVRTGVHAAHDAGDRVGRARKAAGRSARKAKKQTKRSLQKAAKSTKKAVDPVAARITERVGEAFDQVSGH